MSPYCPNCESHVTEQYVRVHGDNTDSIHSCCHCEDLMDKPHHVAPEDARGRY